MKPSYNLEQRLQVQPQIWLFTKIRLYHAEILIFFFASYYKINQINTKTHVYIRFTFKKAPSFSQQLRMHSHSGLFFFFNINSVYIIQFCHHVVYYHPVNYSWNSLRMCGLVGMVIMGWQLDLMILTVLSNITDSMILRNKWNCSAVVEI